MRTSGTLAGLVQALQRLFSSARVILAIMPAFLGLLPSLGGARFSAPIVEEASKGTGLDEDEKARIKAVEIKEGQSLICQKSSFLLAVGDVELSIFFNKNIGAGLFGGEGFVMQKISGNGIAFIEIDGSEYEYDLQADEKFVVSTGHLVSMSETCTIDVEMVSGAKNIFLGGE